LTVALLGTLFLRRRSASVRHSVLAAAMLGVLAVPLLVPMLPHWSLAIVEFNEPTIDEPTLNELQTLESEPIDRPERASDLAQGNALGHWEPTQIAALQGQDIHNDPISCPVGAAELHEQSDTQGGGSMSIDTVALPWARYRALAGRTHANSPTLLLALWSLGTALLLLRLAVSLRAARKIIAKTMPLDEPLMTTITRQLKIAKPVALRQSEVGIVPFTFGLRKPVIVLPETANHWSAEERRAVLTHELSHVARRDVFWQFLSAVCCAVYWFHPLVWLTAWRLRIEREVACDDLVVLAGEEPPVYASMLLRLAGGLKEMPSRRHVLGCTVAMARHHEVKQRIAAILNPNLFRKPLGRFGTAIFLCVAVAAIVLTATMSPFAQPAGETADGRPQTAAETQEPAAVLPGVAPSTGDTAPGSFEAVFLELKGHTATVFSAAFSPDGKKVVTASFDRTARIWNAESGEVLRTLEGHTGVLRAAVFSPDGKTIVTASDDRTARIWNAESGSAHFGKEILKLEGHTDYIWSIAFSPNGKRIATASYDRTAKIWDTESGKVLQTFNGYAYPVVSVAFSPDGERIATASNNWTARLWDAESFHLLKERRGADGASSVAFSPDGKKIVAISGGDIRIWDADMEKELLKLVHPDSVRAELERERRELERPGVRSLGPHFWISSAEFSHDGKKVVAAGLSTTVQTWDAESGEELQKLEGHPDLLCSVAFSPDGKKVVAAGGNTARIWNLAVAALRAQLQQRAGDGAERSPRVNPPASPGTMATPLSPAPLASTPLNVIVITGTVIDTDGKPVGGAIVEPVRVPDLNTTSNAEGRFRFELPATRRGSDVIVSAKLADGSRQGFAGVYYPTLANEAESPLFRFREPTIVLHPKITMTGKVVDADGQAIAGASVAATAFSREVARSVTGDDGTFTFEVPGGTPLNHLFAVKANIGLDYRLFHHDSQRPRRVNDVPVEYDYTEPITLTLDGARRVIAILSVPGGQPAVGVRVTPWLFVDPRKESPAGDNNAASNLFNTLGNDLLSSTTDKNGVAAFDWFPLWQEREVNINVRPAKPGEHSEYFFRHAAVDFDPKKGESVIHYMLPRLAHPISGKVLDEEGKPVSGVLVRIDIVDPGSGMGPGARTVFGVDSYSDEQGRISFVVQTGRRYRGIVTDPRWNAPAIENIFPSATDSIPELVFVVRPQEVPRERAAVSPDVAAREPGTTATPPSPAPLVERQDIIPDYPQDPQQTVTVRGRVFQPDGSPAKDQYLTIQYQMPTRNACIVGGARTNEQGEYSYAIPVGTWMVAMVNNQGRSSEWLHGGLASPVVANFVTENPRVEDYDIHLKPGIRVSGTMRYEDDTVAIGKALIIEAFGFDGRRVRLPARDDGEFRYTQPGSTQHVWSDENGRYTLWLLPDQEYEIRVPDLPGDERRQPLRLTKDEKERTIDFTFPQPTPFVFVLPDGTPTTDVDVSINSRFRIGGGPTADRQIERLQPEADGSFREVLAPVANLISVKTKDRQFGANLVVQGDERLKPITLTLAPAVIGKVKFVEAGTGKPLADRGLSYYPSKRLHDMLLLGNTQRPEDIRTDADGVATLPFMYIGADYRLYDGYEIQPRLPRVEFSPQTPGEVIDLGVREVQ